MNDKIIMDCPVCQAKLSIDLVQIRKEDVLEVPKPPIPKKNKGWFKKKTVEELTKNIPSAPPIPIPKPVILKKQECEFMISDQTKCANMAIKGEKFCKLHRSKA